MNIYETVVAKSSVKELEELISNMAAETEKYRNAFYAAKAFIDCHVADPDITIEMQQKYDLYQIAKRGCWVNITE